jgi:NAD kinase
MLSLNVPESTPIDTSVSPIESLFVTLSTHENPTSSLKKPDIISLRRNSKTCIQLANTTTNLREIYKKVVNSAVSVPYKYRSIFIVVKPCETLTTLLRDVVAWLLEFGFSVIIEDRFEHDPDFKSPLSTPSTPDLIISPASSSSLESLASINDDTAPTAPPTSSYWSSKSSVESLASTNDDAEPTATPTLSFWSSKETTARETDLVITLGGDGTGLSKNNLLKI